MKPRVDGPRALAARLDRAVLRALERRARRAARAMGCRRSQLQGIELRLVDDDRMRALKQRHFGVDEAADVLSFPAGEPIPGEEPGMLGELVLNVDAVGRQAAAPGLTGWLDEATSLVIHGVAHLLGHDHDRAVRARRMMRVERRGSRAVGVRCVRPYAAGRSP